MSEESRSFVICGWSFDKENAIKELTKLIDISKFGDDKSVEDIATFAIKTGWLSDGVQDLRIVESMGKVVIGRLLVYAVGNTLTYSTLSVERLCSDVIELTKHFNIPFGIPFIFTGMADDPTGN